MRRFRLPLLSVLAIIAIIAASSPWWMRALARALVTNESPISADAALVLAGDYYGNRIVKAAELAQQGYVPKVLVSGPDGTYGTYECDLAITYAVRRGFPAKWFVPLPNTALSTDDEAAQTIPAMRKMGVHRLILVTSDYHTARAARLFRRAAPDLELRVVAAPDEHFHADTWWRTRQSRKIFALEWWKTVAAWMGM